MQTIKEFGGSTPQVSAGYFWQTTTPIFLAILLLTVMVIIWQRKWMIKLRMRLRCALRKMALVRDPEMPCPQEQDTARPNTQEQPMLRLSPPRQGMGSKRWRIWLSKSTLSSKERPQWPLLSETKPLGKPRVRQTSIAKLCLCCIDSSGNITVGGYGDWGKERFASSTLIFIS